ncbi:MAG TPA: glutathione S-transferase family protein [Candidatus Binataceae bacterium]|nr:glutathione S-transferase family protein [Candidatus Binataceae bacterium]
MKLHVFPPSPRAMKVIALAEHLQIEHETRIVDLTKGEQMKPDFTALNPNQRMPVLEDDGFVLWESNAILQYLAMKNPAGAALWPSDARRQADVGRWMFWEGAHWAPACGTLGFERVVKRLLGLGEPDAAAIAKGEEEFRRVGGILNGALRGRKWLAGNDLSLADFAVAPWMALAQMAQFPVSGLTEVARWWEAFAATPAMRKALAPLQQR